MPMFKNKSVIDLNSRERWQYMEHVEATATKADRDLAAVLARAQFDEGDKAEFTSIGTLMLAYHINRDAQYKTALLNLLTN